MPTIPASPPDSVSMVRSLSGTDAPVVRADDRKGIPDDGGIVAALRGGREAGASGGGTNPGIGRAQPIEA
jgi:hypothetical protein